MSYSNMSSGSYDYKSSIKFKSPKKMVEEGIENRGTFSEKVGKAVVWFFSGSYNLFSSGCTKLNEYVFTPIWDHALEPLLKKVYNVFESIITGLSDLRIFLKDWIGQPIMENVLTPLSRIVLEAFESIKTGFTSFNRILNEWVFTPFARHVIPRRNAINAIFDSIKTDFITFGRTLNERVFTPLAENILTPLYGEISRLFHFIKTNVSTAATSLNERVFTPLYDAFFKPAFELIQTYASPVLTNLNEWTFKPLYNSLADFFHGIFIGAVAVEADINELRKCFDEFVKTFEIQTKPNEEQDSKEYVCEVLKESYQLSVTNTPAFQMYSDKYHEGRNSAMALYLAHNHSLVIEDKWIESERSCPELVTLFAEKAGLDKATVYF